MIRFVGVKMDWSVTILCLSLIQMSCGESETEVIEKTVLDNIVEKCSYVRGEKVNVTYQVDADNGTVDATIHSPKYCNHTEYEIELQIFEGVDNEKCLGNLSSYYSSLDQWQMHSERSWNSTEDGEVVFKNVFSGCYRFQIKPFINASSEPCLYSDAKYIETNVLKTKIAEETIQIATTPIHKNSSLVVNIARNFTSERTIIALAALIHQHSSTGDACMEHATDHSHCDMFNEISECNSTNNFAVPECRKVPVNYDDSESKTSEKIRCTFFNVTPGAYCVKITVEDDRCVQHSVYKSKKPCTWRTSVIDVTDDSPNKPDVHLQSLSKFSLSLVVLVTIIIIFFIGVIVFMFKRRSPIILALEEPRDETIPMVIKKKILLLYPRDCEQFMTVMKSFGALLEKSHDVEVFDCYHNDDVLDGPLDWLQNKLRNPNFCVLIVTSRCAYLHQEAILAGDWGTSYSLYRDPSFLDRVFVYGLKWVMKDISANPFAKNYIIGFRGFSEDEDILTLPTNWRRYIIPDHLDKLLTDMDINCSSVGTLKNTVQHVNLESEIHSLCKYKSDNPYYLSEILAI